jgi:hypothetical protein
MCFQQMGAAAAVLSKGLEVAKASRDDSWEAAMAFQLAVARVLGGGAGGGGGGSAGGAAEAAAGPAAGGGASGGGGAAAGGGAEAAGPAAAEPAPETFDCGEVLALRERGDAALESVSRWWPAAWDAQRPDGEPDRSVLSGKLIPIAQERGGAPFEAGRRLLVLKNVLYVTRAPGSVPPGAVDRLGAGTRIPEGEEGAEGEGGDGEGDEEEEEEEAEQVVQV